ncbi:hypothetical protein EJW27_10395 [Bacillus albus]|uniref:Methyltransferase putative zinc binding domain-containing protein n=1 Tax=Bacillus albus TaxID=2026189 RepID=A0ABM7E1S8_9BACI|nr:hypothetical protein EJW27_10395 [Bacillus albus]
MHLVKIWNLSRASKSMHSKIYKGLQNGPEKMPFLPLIINKYFFRFRRFPLANSFITPEHSYKMEPFYPLHTFVCHSCLLVQLDEFEPPHNIFMTTYTSAHTHQAGYYTLSNM